MSCISYASLAFLDTQHQGFFFFSFPFFSLSFFFLSTSFHSPSPFGHSSFNSLTQFLPLCFVARFLVFYSHQLLKLHKRHGKSIFKKCSSFCASICCPYITNCSFGFCSNHPPKSAFNAKFFSCHEYRNHVCSVFFFSLSMLLFAPKPYILAHSYPPAEAKIGRKAPDFTAPAVINNEISQVSLSSYRGKWVVLVKISA